MYTYIPEQYIPKYPLKVSIEGTMIILEQLQKYICKVHNGQKIGTGFFCKIFNDVENKFMKVFITNNHILDRNDLNKEFIVVSFNNESIFKKIFFKDRISYTNELIDITIIEIYDNDDQFNYFLEIDSSIYNDIQILKVMIDSPVYALNYSDGKAMVSYGIISEINEKEVFHTCSTNKGASGSPILSLTSNKVIGVHKGFYNGKDDDNKGILINYGLREFFLYLRQKRQNIFINNYQEIFNDEKSIITNPENLGRNNNFLNNNPINEKIPLRRTRSFTKKPQFDLKNNYQANQINNVFNPINQKVENANNINNYQLLYQNLNGALLNNNNVINQANNQIPVQYYNNNYNINNLPQYNNYNNIYYGISNNTNYNNINSNNLDNQFSNLNYYNNSSINQNNIQGNAINNMNNNIQLNNVYYIANDVFDQNFIYI